MQWHYYLLYIVMVKSFSKWVEVEERREGKERDERKKERRQKLVVIIVRAITTLFSNYED